MTALEFLPAVSDKTVVRVQIMKDVKNEQNNAGVGVGRFQLFQLGRPILSNVVFLFLHCVIGCKAHQEPKKGNGFELSSSIFRCFLSIIRAHDNYCLSVRQSGVLHQVPKFKAIYGALQNVIL